MMIIPDGETLRTLTSNYYANNDFSKVEGEIELATEELGNIVGEEIIALALEEMEKADTEADQMLVRKVQRPIALLATLRMYRKNDLSHEDDGRKVKISTDGSEKLPWEWQLDRDDQIHMDEYYASVDALVRYLNQKRPESWINGNTYRMSQQLLVRCGAQLKGYYPVEHAERTYLLLLPFLREAQRLTIMPAYGQQFDELLAEDRLPESEAHYAAAQATVMLALSLALRRLPLSIIPSGIVRGYMADNGMKASRAASMDDVQRVAKWMERDASRWIDRMKRSRDSKQPEYETVPKNDVNNKYCIL